MDHQRARRGLAATAAVLVSTVLSTGPALGQVDQHPSEVSNQPTDNLGGAELLRTEDALLSRHDDRLEIEIRLATPTPGSYDYPDSVPPERYAAPELFTMWVFIFNHPENCISDPEPPRCGGEDFSEAVRSGVYNGGAHVSSIDHSGGTFELDRYSNNQVVMQTRIDVGDPPRPNSPPGSEHLFGLENPLGAEVHVAIAPHGQIDPGTLGVEAFAPAGNPTCGCWWVATFPVPESD